MQSCRELNDVSFEIRIESLKSELIEILEGYEKIHFIWLTRYII